MAVSSSDPVLRSCCIALVRVALAEDEGALPVFRTRADLSTALFTFTVTPASGGVLGLFVSTDDMLLAFPAGDTASKKSLPWVLKAKPGTTYPIRLAYGVITLHRGLPPWA